MHKLLIYLILFVKQQYTAHGYRLQIKAKNDCLAFKNNEQIRDSYKIILHKWELAIHICIICINHEISSLSQKALGTIFYLVLQQENRILIIWIFISISGCLKTKILKNITLCQL